MYNGLGAFISEVKALGFLVKLDINGSLPAELIRLVETGNVDYVTMYIENTPDKYTLIIGMTQYDLKPVETSVHFLLSGRGGVSVKKLKCSADA